MERNKIITKGNNTYQYDENNRQLVYLSPIVNEFADLAKQGVDVTQHKDKYVKQTAEKYELPEEQVWPEYKKYVFLKEHGVFSSDTNSYVAGRLTPSRIRYELANIKQVVFEVTDACNLKCKYCAYGEFYSDYDDRENKNLDLATALNLLKYMEGFWRSEWNTSSEHQVIIGFYGGEPLVNFEFIKTIVEYTQKLDIPGISFGYSMTTNAVLLDRYMDFIAQHNFILLLSLDGDKEGNGYRVFHSGESSFDKVYGNIKLLQEKYPEYFKEHVNFNTVLHNKNDVKGIHAFFKDSFDKQPTISPLNNSGIRVDKQELFQRTYRNLNENLKESENYEEISEDLFTKDPTVNELTFFLHRFTNNVHRNYTTLFRDQKNISYLPTGTCTPFSRKLFLTVNGKIFPCERIGQLFPLGYADAEQVDLNFEQIAAFYNSVYDKLQAQCSRCLRRYNCLQCIFHLEDVQGNPKCHGFMNDAMFNRYMVHNLTYLEGHPKNYARIMEEVIFY